VLAKSGKNLIREIARLTKISATAVSARIRSIVQSLAIVYLIHLRRFPAEDEAALAYDRAASLLLGPAATLNFEAPPEDPWATVHTAILLEQALGPSTPSSIVAVANGEGLPRDIAAAVRANKSIRRQLDARTVLTFQRRQQSLMHSQHECQQSPLNPLAQLESQAPQPLARPEAEPHHPWQTPRSGSQPPDLHPFSPEPEQGDQQQLHLEQRTAARDQPQASGPTGPATTPPATQHAALPHVSVNHLLHLASLVCDEGGHHNAVHPSHARPQIIDGSCIESASSLAPRESLPPTAAHGGADPAAIQKARLAQLRPSTQQPHAIGNAAGGIDIAAGLHGSSSNQRVAPPAQTSSRGRSAASARAASPGPPRPPLPKPLPAAAVSPEQLEADRQLLPDAQLACRSLGSAAAAAAANARPGAPVAVHVSKASRPALQPVIALAVRHLERLLALMPELLLEALQDIEQTIALQDLPEEVVASHAAAMAAVRTLIELRGRAPAHAPGAMYVQPQWQQQGATRDAAPVTRTAR
jgi:hypothetical protein